MTRGKAIKGINKALRFLFDGMKPSGLDIRMGRQQYYHHSDMNKAAHFDWRHWQIIVETRTVLNFGPQLARALAPVQYATYVQIMRLYWCDSGLGVATAVQKADIVCASERDFEKVMTAFEVLKDETLVPALAGITGAESLMEMLLG